MDQPEDLFASQQHYLFSIVGVIYDSPRPLTLDEIAYKARPQPTNKLLPVLTHLVFAGYLEVITENNVARYQIATHHLGPLYPLPYHLISDNIP